MEARSRSKDIASIVLLGLTGAGKSTTFSTTFGTQMETVANFTSATSTILENSIEVQMPNGEKKELIVIDTPGFGDTRQRAFERDAQLLATLEHYLKHHRELKSCYPSIVLLVMKFNDDRIIHETSHFIQMLKAINNFVNNGALIDKSRSSCNLVVVLTHLMSEENAQLQVDPTPKIKIISGLFKEYTTIAPPYFVVVGENKPEAYKLPERNGYWQLPTGDFYPYNLFQMIDKVTDAAKDNVANDIFREAFKNPMALKKSLKKQVPLMQVESPMVNRYFISLKNSKFKIENSEISMKIATIWSNLSDNLTANSGSTLQHVQKRFHEHNIITSENLPKTLYQVVNLISNLPLTPAVTQVLKQLGIQAPDYPEGFGVLGKFYDLVTDEPKSTSPYAFPHLELSPVGFMTPVGIKIEEVFETNLVLELFERSEDYSAYRLRQLRLHKQVPVSVIQCEVSKPGCNLLTNLYKSGVATGIKEFKVYKISTTKPSLGKEYSDFLETLPKFKPKSKTKVPMWQQYVNRGTHVLKSAYAGGYVAVRAKRNVHVELSTTPEKIKYTVEEMLENVGNFCSTKFAKGIDDFEFSMDFVGGDKNLARIDISRMFSSEGVEFFKAWEASLKYHPILLLSEASLENVADVLPIELLHMEPHIRLCLSSLLGITEDKKGKSKGPIARHKITGKKARDCIVM